jgi:hypothetical protein
VVPENIHDFFMASAGAAGALVGLLFVAISVTTDRLTREGVDAQLHRIRAEAALTAFTNALTVSLFALVPGEKIGGTAVAVSIVGIGFVTASLLSLIRLRQWHWSLVRDGLFLIGLVAIFVIQLVQGAEVLAHPGDSGAVNTIAILVVVCFLVGVGRSWELIGGPSIGISQEVTALIRGHERGKNHPGDDPTPAAGGPPAAGNPPAAGSPPAAGNPPAGG